MRGTVPGQEQKRESKRLAATLSIFSDVKRSSMNEAVSRAAKGSKQHDCQP